MEHSKVDPGAADPRPRRDVVVEHVTVIDEGQGAISVRWSYLASAIAVFAIAAGLLVTSVGSGRGSGHASARSRLTAPAGVQQAETPPVGVSYRQFLASHPYLPGLTKRVAAKGACDVWESAALPRVAGRAFAMQTAVAQVAIMPGRARGEATWQPAC